MQNTVSVNSKFTTEAPRCRFCGCCIPIDLLGFEWKGEDVFCSVQCEARQDDFVRDKDIKQKNEAVIIAAKLKFPGITDCIGHTNKYGTRAYFHFPGGMWFADWAIGERSADPNLVDKDAWNIYLANLRYQERLAKDGGQ